MQVYNYFCASKKHFPLPLDILFSTFIVHKYFCHVCNIVVAVAGGERRTKYGCEGSSLELECEEGAVISLVRANYGRFSISICNGEGNTAWSVNCMEPRTLRIINTRYCSELTRAN